MPSGGQYAGTTDVAVDGWNGDGCVASKDLAEAYLPAGLQRVVAFFEEARLCFGHELLDVHAGSGKLGEQGADRGGAKIGADGLLDPGVANLDGDARAVLSHPAVDLPNRSAGHRLALESREQRLSARAEIPDDGPLDERKGGGL